jgi:hypothetical protein
MNSKKGYGFIAKAAKGAKKRKEKRRKARAKWNESLRRGLRFFADFATLRQG